VKISVLAVGKLKEEFYREGCSFYLSRLRPFCPVEMVEGAKERGESESDREAAYGGLRPRFAKAQLRVALDLRGKAMDSTALARFLGRALDRGTGAAAFLVGGPSGLPKAALADATDLLSLSPMTLPHQMARMVLLEQLYRGFSILRGGPYHR
jgi:23S rRNA (pseudouridine1915-N3)-methyltransferase